VDENSVYRIGTLSQMFTVYAFLRAAGEEHWGDSVTKWVPELANASQTLNDQSKYMDWNAITLGDLAGHLSGIARDCKVSQKMLGVLADDQV
jgi:CubicO group peptidase (beta-lactamase class C family)